uniref:Uncharacterized protein n=1 Tax=Pithovirus LCPAC406 TaxID=2506599 RepID=A0A481ZD64_9VIRU|nr:MAG: hypothetical protein LCPAC406_01680 [Pithovirus LCPAC406]
MYVYIVRSENLDDKEYDITVEVYDNYNDALNEAERLMLLKIKKVYGNASVDEERVKFQDYPDILYNYGSISIQNMIIEIIRREVH